MKHKLTQRNIILVLSLALFDCNIVWDCLSRVNKTECDIESVSLP